MKKFFFSILAVGALVACTKSEVKYDDASELSFAPVASTVTKVANMGAIDGVTYPINEDFRVWGYWQLLDADSDHSAFNNATSYIDNKVFSHKDGQTWKGKDKSYYWPKTGSMVFACLSPADAPVTNLSHNVVTDNFSFKYAGTNNTAATVDIMWSNTTNSFNEKNVAAAGVPVQFNHALSWITFKFKGDDVTSHGGFAINSLVIDNLYVGGTFNSNTQTWSSFTTAASMDVFKATGPMDLTKEFVIFEDAEQGTLVVPQTNVTAGLGANYSYTATLKFTNKLGDVHINETVKLDLGKGWEIGKHYTYYITMTASEILISPEVVDWAEVDPADQFEF